MQQNQETNLTFTKKNISQQTHQEKPQDKITTHALKHTKIPLHIHMNDGLIFKVREPRGNDTTNATIHSAFFLCSLLEKRVYVVCKSTCVWLIIDFFLEKTEKRITRGFVCGRVFCIFWQTWKNTIGGYYTKNIAKK